MACNIDKLRDLLDRRGLDAVLVRSKTMKGWMATQTGGGCSVVIDHEGAFLVLDGRYVAEAGEKEHDLVIDLLPSQSREALYDRLDRMARERGWRRLGLEGDETLARDYLRISRFVEEPVLLDDDMAILRAVKTDEEIDKIQRAVDVTDDIFATVVPQLRVGMTEFDISALLQYESIRRGAQKMAFDTICSIGEAHRLSPWPPHVPRAATRGSRDDGLWHPAGQLPVGHDEGLLHG